MTRWKREARATLLLMHAHHRYSRYNDSLHQAADELGLIVGFVEYPNCSGDGSWDREWYVMADQLAAVGGIRAVHDRADDIRDAEYRRQRDATPRDERPW